MEEGITINTPMGMLDVMPTLGNMLNIYNKYAPYSFKVVRDKAKEFAKTIVFLCRDIRRWKYIARQQASSVL